MVHNRTFKLYGKKYHSDKNGVVRKLSRKKQKNNGKTILVDKTIDGIILSDEDMIMPTVQ